MEFDIIDWRLFKEYKHSESSPNGLDNFQFLLKYLEVFHKLGSVQDYYDILSNDEIAILMLNKRSLDSVEALEKYLIDVNKEALFAKENS